MTQFTQCFAFDLAGALASNPKLAADFFERARAAIFEASSAIE
jgi:hypothetical protein